ncbi:hypothetical protein [Micromonospora sp. NPDC005806]|uniref:hypothetical protein n=1 Tax=Micromonospora sp. NPDC005806 TaxID=3364234 RepID=UPI0036A477E8
MPVVEVPVPQALADLAGALRTTGMYGPRPDDEDFVEVRALAWSRCREFLPDWPDAPELPGQRRQELIDAFMVGACRPVAAGAGVPAGCDVDREVARSLADIFVDYGTRTSGPVCWRGVPGGLQCFWATGCLAKPSSTTRSRRFCPLHRREVDAEWVEPVVATADIYLCDFLAAVDDESAWGPAKQLAAELTARGVDVSDMAAVDVVIGELNAARLARRVTE